MHKLLQNRVVLIVFLALLFKGACAQRQRALLSRNP
jgi:hypothetical protein